MNATGAVNALPALTDVNADHPPSAAASADQERGVLVARMLALAAGKSDAFVAYLDPALVDAAWPGARSWVAALQDPVALREASSVLRTAWAVNWPGLSALANRLNRTALLPRDATLTWLCAAALFIRRRDVRRCVGRVQRQALVDMVGAHVLEAIVATPESALAPPDAPPLEGQTMNGLACWAFLTLSEHGAWSSERARRLIGLCLPPDAALACDSTRRTRLQPLPLGAFSDQLPHYFPDYSWLFGSNMDRALSA